MDETMLESLEEIMEKCKEQGIENAVSLTVELIKYKKGMCLTENQITMCISIAGKNEDQFIEELLKQNAINKSFYKKVSNFQNILSGISTVIDFAECINDIYRNIDGYVKGNINVAPEALENYLTLLGDIVGFIPSCGLVSAQLSLAADLLATETKIVNKWMAKYEELDKAINNVNDGTSSIIDEKEVKNFYSEICELKNGGTEDGIKFYNAMLNQYGWIFELAGIDLNELRNYQGQLNMMQSRTSTLFAEVDKIAGIDINVNYEISDYEIELNKQKIEEAESSKKYDPLVIDLNKNGKYSVNTENGVYFDYSGDGFAEKTAWIEEGDGMLVFDRNNNGVIDDGSELFGDKTIMNNGTYAANGFQALSELDTNKDGRIDSSDELFSELKVWIDSNRDGISQKNELYSLTDLGITSLSLSAQNYNKTDSEGNVVSKKATVTYEDGTVGDMVEMNFNISSTDTNLKQVINVPDEIRNIYPQLKATGNMYTLQEAMTLDRELLEMVSEFMNTKNMLKSYELVDKIIVRWTGTEDIEDGSRGSYVNAKELSVIEKFYGKEFVGVDGRNPNNTAGPMLSKVYDELRSDIFTSLLSQTVLKEFCNATSIKENFISGKQRIDYTDVIGMLESEILKDRTNGLLKIKFYLETISNFKATKDIYDIEIFKENVNVSEYKSMFIDALNLNIIKGDDLNNTLYGKSVNDIIIGGEGNDNLLGGGGDDTYVFYKGSGNDIIYDRYGTNTIRFTDDTKPEDIEVRKEGNYNAVISIKGREDTITIQDFFYRTEYRQFNFEFSDGRTATIDLENLKLLYESFETSILDIDKTSQTNAELLQTMLTNEKLSDNNESAIVFSDSMIILETDTEDNINIDTKVNLLVQELSSSEENNNIFTNDTSQEKTTELFTEQYTVN